VFQRDDETTGCDRRPHHVLADHLVR